MALAGRTLGKCWFTSHGGHHVGCCRILLHISNSGQTKVGEFEDGITVSVSAEHHIPRFYVSVDDGVLQAVEMSNRTGNLQHKGENSWGY